MSKEKLEKEKLEIEKIFVVSTSHVKSESLMNKLSYESAAFINEYASIFYIEKEEVFDWEELSNELRQLANMCRDLKCEWLMLDESGNQVDGIKTYNW